MLRRSVLLTILLVICLLLAACEADFGIEQLGMGITDSSDGGSDSPDYDVMDRGPVRGGVLKLFTTTPDTLDPILTKNTYVGDFLSFIYEGLVKLDRNGRPTPVLSDSWTVSEDGLVWNFHMRDGVRWQDGQPLTAEDVQYTFDYILSSKVDSVYKRQLQNIATYTATDDSDFKMVLRKPNSFTPEMMTFPIMPGGAPAKSGLSDGESFRPVGTGPFRFDSYEKGKKVALLANDGWWQLNGQGGKAGEGMYLRGIDVSVYKNPDDAVNAFQTGDADAVCINTADFNKYNGRTDLIIKKYISRDFEFLAFNMYNPVFAEGAVRKAVASAINRDSIIREACGGDAVAAELPISPESWILGDIGKTDGEETVPVGELLKQGGWQEKTRELRENEGKYYKSIGGIRKDLEIEILVNSNNSSRINAADIICSQLKSRGIPARVTPLAWNELLARIDSRKYDMALLGCRITQIPDISFLYSSSYLPAYLSLQDDSGRDISGYNNPEVNSYIEKIFAEQSDDKKKAMYFNMKQIIDEDSPYIGLYFTENAFIYRKNVRGLLDPYTWDRYNDITQWYKPELQ